MNIEGGTHHSPAAKPIRQLYQNAQNVKLNEPTTPKKTCPNNIKKQQMPQNKNRSPIKTQITRNKTKENFSHMHTPNKKKTTIQIRNSYVEIVH